MKTMRFSHKYHKLVGLDGDTVRELKLLEVVLTDLSDLSSHFLEYDTDHGTYRLPPKGLYMMLIFLKPSGNDLLTTLRRFTADKYDYYSKAVGEKFGVEIRP